MLLRTDLLPVYHLGQSQLLTSWGSEEFSRKYRISLIFFWGQWGLPLPRRHPIISLIGSPIPGAEQVSHTCKYMHACTHATLLTFASAAAEACRMVWCLAVKQDDHPSQEAIDALHAQFSAAIKKLFDDHKHLLGIEWAKKELRIV